MTVAIRQTVRIQSGGVIEVCSPELREGYNADVIILMDGPVAEHQTMVSMIGAAKGGFATSEEVDDFIREERNAWDS